jgi:HTH-type transcriptional regulator / antitoxin HipB
MINKSNITTFEEHLNKQYGDFGTPEREVFEMQSLTFRIGELIKEQRKKADLTQEELALRAGTKKSYISRIENGKSDIQFSTLLRIIEVGLGKQVNFVIN